MVVGSIPVAVTQSLNIAPVSSKEFLDIQAITECRFTLIELMFNCSKSTFQDVMILFS